MAKNITTISTVMVHEIEITKKIEKLNFFLTKVVHWIRREKRKRRKTKKRLERIKE